MLCPKCGQNDSKVVDSRSSEDNSTIRRRRECLNCGSRFTTYERREESPLMVQKRDGHVEPFDSAKLLRSLLAATAKRDIPLARLETLVSDVESDLRERFKGDVPSTAVGDQVLLHLEGLDIVAYIRFASVYKDFKSLDEFTNELKKLSESKQVD